MGDPTLSQFIEGWPLFREPVLAAACAGGLLGALGVYVVLGRMVFLSAALSQSAGLGVALAFFAQLHLAVSPSMASPALGAALVTFLALGLIMRDRSVEGHRRDGLLGLVFLVGSGGTLIVGTRIVQEVQDIQTLLFGTAVAVLPEDLRALAVLTALVGAVHLIGARGFVEVVFDPDGARVRGLPVGGLRAALLVTMAASVSLVTQVLGALPAFAFSVLPALAVVPLASNVPRAMLMAAVAGASMGALGYLMAFFYDLPVGASQALVGVAMVGLGGGLGRAIGWAFGVVRSRR